MPNSTAGRPSPREDESPNRGRREFLLLIPVGIFAGVAATIAAAALRYLRPSLPGAASEAKWSNVAHVSELKGDKPIMRSIITEHQAGWASTTEEHFVYVLPNQNNRVLSSVCPHEGCNVAWRDDASEFFCPCHDSYFAADGSRINGPARRGLDPLPSREKEGVLQVQYQTFVNNTEERSARG
jgi:menaquinol-cytochrome c reductase iron-sulfur subunit